MYENSVQNFRRSSVSKAVDYRFKEKINLRSASLHDIGSSEGEATTENICDCAVLYIVYFFFNCGFIEFLIEIFKIGLVKFVLAAVSQS